MTAILTVQNLEKAFGTRRILDGASFAVHEGDRIALVGVNGSGKTTVLKMLVGELAPDEAPDAGLVTRKRGLTIEYVAQEPKIDPARTVGETLREGLRAHQAALDALARVEASIPSLAGAELEAALHEQAHLHEILRKKGWDRDHEIRGLAAALALPAEHRPVGELSIGERRRVAIARALLAAPELLALDEPTNHLDARTIGWLEARLLERKGALLLVTHDRYFLDRVATRILELDRGKVHAYEGGYTRFLEKQTDRLDNESAREAERKSFIRRELDWIRRGPAARTTKQQARIDRFDAAVASAPTATRSGPMALRLSTGGRLGKSILELKKLTRKGLFENLDLVFKPGDRIGVVGPNGAGKTTLVRTILGQLAPDAGEVVVGLNTKFAFLDQGRAELRDDRTVLQEVAGDNDTVFLEDGPVHARTFLRMLLFEDPAADTPVGLLSGGERNRVQLAKLLRKGGNFLVLDEPTNDLDLMTLGVLEEALANFGGCALVVSHDRWFLDRIATGILAFEGDGKVGFYEGSCSDYLARPRAVDVPAPPVPVAPRPVAAPQQTSKKKLGFKEKQELAAIEGTILEAETRVGDLEKTLQDPTIYQTRAAEVPALVAALDEAKQKVDALYARWQALESLKEG